MAQSITLTPEQAYSALPGFGDRIRFRGQNVALSWTHTISPTMLNEVRIGFSRNMDIGTCASCPAQTRIYGELRYPGSQRTVTGG